MLCDAGRPAESLFRLEGPDRFVQIYACDGEQYQAYELDAGWYAPDARLKKRIKVLRSQGDIVSAPLDESTRGGTVTSFPSKR